MPNGYNVAEYGLGMGFFNPMWQQIVRDAQFDEMELQKAATTGEGVVQPSTGPLGPSTAGDDRPLRVQYMHDKLEVATMSQDDARFFKRHPIEKVYSNTFEWTRYEQFGGAGDGFVLESGFQQSANQFGQNISDDNFSRQIAQIKYMAATRNVSLPAQLVRSVSDPEKAAETGATNELIYKCNNSMYWGDGLKTFSQFNGIKAQILGHVNFNPADYAILYDAGGSPITKDLLEDVLVISRMKFGKPSVVINSTPTYGDSQKLLFPETRFMEGADGSFGQNRRNFHGPDGDVYLENDPLLRINRPGVLEGPGSDGRPRTTSTTVSPADANSITWASTPYTTPPSSVAPGAGYFWQFANVNTDAAVLATVPALPSGDGNNGNRLQAGNYYVAVAPVYGGLEGPAWVYGHTGVMASLTASANAEAITAATAIQPAAGQVIQIDVAAAAITGLGATYPRNLTKVRVYIYGGPNAAAPTSLAQFNLLEECAFPTNGNTRLYHNGFVIPGTDNSFAITERKNGEKMMFFAQLLPLMRRLNLPSFLMGDPLAMLLFGTPIYLVPRFNVWIRNIGRA